MLGVHDMLNNYLFPNLNFEIFIYDSLVLKQSREKHKHDLEKGAIRFTGFKQIFT